MSVYRLAYNLHHDAEEQKFCNLEIVDMYVRPA